MKKPTLGETAVRMPEQDCRTCGYKLDAATHTAFDGRAPKVGDLSVCVKCGEISMFGVGFVLQPVPDDVFINMDASERYSLFKMQMAIKKRGKDK